MGRKFWLVGVLLLVTNDLYAIEALTSSSLSKAEKLLVNQYQLKLEKQNLAVSELEAVVIKMAAEPNLQALFNKSRNKNPFDISSPQLYTWDPGVLTEAEKDSIINFQNTVASYLSAKDVLVAMKKEEPTLKPLKLAPSFQINTGNSTSTYIPTIEALGSFPVSITYNNKSYKDNFDIQFLLSLRPDPPSGETKNVAQSIRINTGVFSANLGFNWNCFWVPETGKTDDPNDHSPQGLEIRAGVPVSYQRANATTSTTSTSSTVDFGIVSPELKVSLWLKYVLLGYKYTYHSTFGSENNVANDLKDSTNHKVYLATRIDALSGTDTPFYLETSYTSNRNTFNEGIFSIGFSKVLSWSLNK